MTRGELVKGSAIFLILAVAGLFSAASVERHYAPDTSTACVGDDGSWKHWIWANVPMLSPKCR